MFKRILAQSAVLALAAALTSCGEADAEKASGQIAAKVNGHEISVHRIDNAMARDGARAAGRAGRAAAEALERMIDQELLVQKALAAQLDRDPKVMQAIEAARREVLAQAYIEKIAAPTLMAAATPAEVGKFYKENPALFAQRRIYRVRELQVQATQEEIHALEAAAAGANSLDEVAAWLKSRTLPFRAATSRRPAEQVPLAILAELSAMRDGQIAVFARRGGASAIQLLDAQDASLSEEQAAPLIGRYLHSRKQLEAARAEVTRLRAQAQIEYLGEFKKTSGETRHARAN